MARIIKLWKERKTLKAARQNWHITYGRPPTGRTADLHVKLEQEVARPPGTERKLPTANPIPSEKVQSEGEMKTFSGAGVLRGFVASGLIIRVPELERK